MRSILAIFAVVTSFHFAYSVIPPVHWTIYKNCDNPNRRDAIETAINTAKDRSAKAAAALRATPMDSRVEAVSKMLLGEDDWQNKVNTVVELYERLADLVGPAGKRSEGDFTNTPEWSGFAQSDTHWRNFVVMCGPDFSFGDKNDETFRPDGVFDNVRFEGIRKTAGIYEMYQDVNAARSNPAKTYEVFAETRAEESKGVDGAPSGVWRRRFPETIVLHPLFLSDIEAHNYKLLTDQRLAKAADPTAWRVFKSWFKTRLTSRQNRGTPVDSLFGLDGTLHHEIFHLSVFGNLLDQPDHDHAYGWSAQVANKRSDNPENLAFLAMCIWMVVEKGATVDAKGRVKMSS
ncbi:hypothetical protein F5Y06DRAFT_308124 [Hypoxylon sp. FL0890]|nr:hypothetical protein F5Y06DRAFT_308124 [Hypoxylon sp. FL0890]